ncbi:MAG: hypothetical protein U0132_00130 [Gemmatimonadaceae bacterium]
MLAAKRMRGLLFIVGCSLTPTACRQERPSRVPDSAVVRTVPVPSAPTNILPSPTWDQRTGSFFVVPASTAESALVIFPEFTNDISIDSAHFDTDRAANSTVMLTRDGEGVGSARLAKLVVEKVEDCPAWPRAQLVSTLPGQALPTDWGVGLVGSTTALRLAQLAHMSERDSARVTVVIARLASGLADDTSTVFRGRPFVVRQVTTVHTERAPFLFAEVVRTIDQEAMPLQEHLTIIAEPDSTQVGGYRVAYSERTTGTEETVETTELLAALAPDGETIQLLVSRELGEGVSYAVIAREGTRGWRVRWTSAYAGC